MFGQDDLSPTALEAIGAPESEVFVSLISFWEVAIKHAKGRLELVESPEDFFTTQMAKNGFELLQLTPRHVFTAAALPLHDHRDPFDRVLAAQALTEELLLVSVDQKLDQYGLKRLS